MKGRKCLISKNGFQHIVTARNLFFIAAILVNIKYQFNEAIVLFKTFVKMHVLVLKL